MTLKPTNIILIVCLSLILISCATNKYFSLGKNCNLSEQYEKAIFFLNKAIELEPNSARAFNERGISNHLLDDKLKAISDFDKAIELNPDYADAYFNRGVVYSKINAYEKAISDFYKVIKLNPAYKKDHVLRQITYCLKERRKQQKIYNSLIYSEKLRKLIRGGN